MVRVLHSVSNMDRAGIETMLMNYYRRMNRDKVQFDFLCNKKKPGAYDAEIAELGGRIFHTPGLNPAKYPQYLQYMKGLFAAHPEYRIIEAHNGALGVYALHAAKAAGIPVRIFHAHGASITKDWKYPLKVVCKALLPSNMNRHFSCGIAAAQCYFGRRVVERGDYELIPNAIETGRFAFSPAVREAIRERHGLQGRHVVGHVGRFMAQKNHAFLLEVFAALAQRDPAASLVLLGDGELQGEIRKRAEAKGLANRILFAGNVGNAHEWYHAFDVFVLPSIWEGLPVVGVEAQANDLPCIFSDRVTREIGLSDKAEFLSLELPASAWAERILARFADTGRRDNTQLITDSHYNIAEEAARLQGRYLALYEGRA